MSPDGTLVLVVKKDAGGLCVGFDGFSWHIHSSSLLGCVPKAKRGEMTDDDVVSEYVSRVLNDDLIIAVLSIDSKVTEVWVSDNPIRDMKYKSEHEELSFRRWSGIRVAVEC